MLTLGEPITTHKGCANYNREDIQGHLIIDDSVSDMPDFRGCTKITSVSIGKNVKKIKKTCFAECPNINSYYVSPNNPYYESIDGNIYTKKKGKRLVRYAAGKEASEFAVPEGVAEIECNAFDDASHLKRLFLPLSLIKIKADEHGAVFKNCFSIEYFEVEKYNQNYCACGGNLYNKAGDRLIRYAAGNNADHFITPDCCTNIRPYAFYSASNLRAVTLGRCLKLISRGAFMNCTNLQKAEFEENSRLFEIDSFAFANTAISHFIIPSSAGRLGASIFRNTPIQSLYIHSLGITECSDSMIDSSYETKVFLNMRKAPQSWHPTWNIDKHSSKRNSVSGFTPLWWYMENIYSP